MQKVELFTIFPFRGIAAKPATRHIETAEKASTSQPSPIQQDQPTSGWSGVLSDSSWVISTQVSGQSKQWFGFGFGFPLPLLIMICVKDRFAGSVRLTSIPKLDANAIGLVSIASRIAEKHVLFSAGSPVLCMQDKTSDPSRNLSVALSFSGGSDKPYF